MKRPEFSMFFVVLVSLIIFLVWQWNVSSDLINPYFQQNTGVLKIVYYGSATILFLGFLYFGYQSTGKREVKRIDYYFTGCALIVASILYMGSFYLVLAPNGDNAEYIINAKSLIDRGGFFRLDTPGETPNSLASIGLPLLLAPSYGLWGFNFLPMKLTILLLSLAIGPLLFIFFRQDYDFYTSTILALTGFVSPYLIANSTTIMTEAPYLFWSLGTLITIRRFADGKSINWTLYILFFFLLIWTYLTRAIGVALIMAVLLYLGSRIPWKMIFLSKAKKRSSRLHFQKFILIFVPLMVGILVWQWHQQQIGISQFNVFIRLDWIDHLLNNFVAFTNVLGHFFSSADAFRWYKQSSGYILSPVNIFSLTVQLLILIGLAVDLWKKKLVAFYTLSFLVILLVASVTPQERVFMRYISVLIPFILYHLYSGIRFILIPLATSRVRSLSILSSVLPITTLGLVFITHLSADRYNVFTKGAIYNAWYGSFLKAASWCGDNLPSDAYVMSVKPRLVYVYSGLHGLAIGNERDVYTPEYEKQKLEEIKSKGITHIIVDAISKATMENFYPVIQNNPDKFEKLAVPGLEDKCTVVRVRSY